MVVHVKKNLVIVYLSTSGNTKKMADAIAEGADSRGIRRKRGKFLRRRHGQGTSG